MFTAQYTRPTSDTASSLFGTFYFYARLPLFFRFMPKLCLFKHKWTSNDKKHDWRLGKFSIYLSVARFLVYKWFQLRISSDCRSEVKVELLSNYCQSNWLAKRGLFCFQERAQYSNQFPLSTVFFGPIQFLLRRGIALIRN